MAVSRQTPVSSSKPGLATHAEFVAATDLLADLANKAAAAEAAHREANDAQSSGRGSYRDQQDFLAAQSLVSGVAVVEAPADLDALAREVRITRLAAAEQQRVLTELGDRLESSTVAEDRPQNDALALDVLQAMRALQDAYATYLAFQADRRRRFGGRSSLPLVQLETRFAASIPPAAAQFEGGLAHFGINAGGE